MAALISIFLLLTTARFLLAMRYLARWSDRSRSSEPVAVLQPILSGDRLLEHMLGENSRDLPSARLLWLVDSDDPEGQRAARRAAGPNVAILTGPGPAPGENPKSAKLARALPSVTEPALVVLDDDTHLDGDGLAVLLGALHDAPLVTGLPVFAAKSGIAERLIGGFVNGSAALTYLPAAAVGAQHTINGMIYAVRTDTLRSLGGFAAIQMELTDDYALARLFEDAGHPLLQAPVPVEVRLTVRNVAHAASVLRRWFLFANRYLRHNASAATLLLIVVPALLPPAIVAVGLFSGSIGALCFALAAKAAANAVLARRLGRVPSLSGAFFEMLADVAAPVFAVSALFRPNQLTWRNRRITMAGSRIEYR